MLSVAGAAAMWAYGPAWYSLAIIAISFPCAWAGGRLHARGSARADGAGAPGGAGAPRIAGFWCRPVVRVDSAAPRSTYR